MKRSLLVLSLIGLGIFGLSQNAITSSSGSPTGRSGSPASSGRTCATGCHSGPSQSTQTVNITTDIPASGFEENTDYTITISTDANGAVGSKIGFAASVEDASGAHMGTLSSPDNRSNVSNNFATHTSSSLPAAGGTNSWNLDWNSGSAVDGTTIYVAVNFANDNGTTSGDVIATQTLTLSKASGISIEENQLSSLTLFPNPATEYIMVGMSLNTPDAVDYHIIDLSGKVVKSENLGSLGTGEQSFTVSLSDITPGQYIMHVQSGENVYTERFTVR